MKSTMGSAPRTEDAALRMMRLSDDWLAPLVKRLPVVLCLDTSGSMGFKGADGHAPIDFVCTGIRKLHSELCADVRARETVDLCVLTFGGNDKRQVSTLKAFGPITDWDPPTTLRASGQTYLGAALDTALRLVGERLEEYKRNAVLSYAPWLIMMTDGRTSEQDIPLLKQVVKELKARLVAQSLYLYSFFACEPENLSKEITKVALSALRKFYPDGETQWPKVMGKDKQSFRELFRWVSVSVSRANGTTVPMLPRLEPYPQEGGLS